MKRKYPALALTALLVLCALSACAAPAPTAHDLQRSIVYPVSPVPISCRAEGELAQGEAWADQYLAPAQSVQEYIYQGLLAESSEIDISAYKIPTGQIVDLFTDVMNHHPDLFYVQSGISYTYDNSGNIIAIKPSYRMTGQQLKDARSVCEQKLDEICAGVDETWSDLEIALYLHDYLCLHYAYDTNYEYYDMYSFLTLGKGVCQAYTLTYMALLTRYGIEVDVATSSAMNHIWNIVVLGGVPYHVDVTWDDPVPDIEGGAMHANFLRSDDGIAGTGHYGWICAHTCSSYAYDYTFMSEVTQPFSYTAGKWYYANGAEHGVFQADFSTMSARKVIEIEDEWFTPDGYGYYLDAFIGVGTYRGNLIYNTPDRILAYNQKSGVTVEVPIPELTYEQIFGLWVEGETVYYLVSDAPDGYMEKRSCSIADLADYLWGDADQNGVLDGRDVTAIRRYLEDLPTVCHTGAADVDDSGRVDGRDVEILRRYLVENH